MRAVRAVRARQARHCGHGLRQRDAFAHVIALPEHRLVRCLGGLDRIAAAPDPAVLSLQQQAVAQADAVVQALERGLCTRQQAIGLVDLEGEGCRFGAREVQPRRHAPAGAIGAHGERPLSRWRRCQASVTGGASHAGWRAARRSSRTKSSSCRQCAGWREASRFCAGSPGLSPLLGVPETPLLRLVSPPSEFHRSGGDSVPFNPRVRISGSL